MELAVYNTLLHQLVSDGGVEADRYLTTRSISFKQKKNKPQVKEAY